MKTTLRMFLFLLPLASGAVSTLRAQQGTSDRVIDYAAAHLPG